MSACARTATFVLLTAGLAGCTILEGGAGRIPLGPGRPPPPLQGADADGRPLALADYRGKVVLLDFWKDG
jgi:hypothetical protein